MLWFKSPEAEATNCSSFPLVCWLVSVSIQDPCSPPPLTQSRSIHQIYCSTDEDQASTLITDLPLSVRVSGVERKGRLQAEAETLNK
ncbi:hypothetical protein QQF64_030283 [Cirrhinus molitorella]|uniref:Uncharacterized protein n=1 Tax=Cirrhinus molitorella TaxID=172907 RepID=A0ABR3N331_9TELE